MDYTDDELFKPLEINPKYSINKLGQVMNNKTLRILKNIKRKTCDKVRLKNVDYDIDNLITQTFYPEEWQRELEERNEFCRLMTMLIFN